MNLKSLIKKFSLVELESIKKEIDDEILIRYRNNHEAIDVMQLDISARALNVLRGNSINTLNELTLKKPSQLKNIGLKTIQELSEQLTLHGMKWAD